MRAEVVSAQLVLPFRLRDDATFSNFFKGNNAAVLNYLQRMIAGEDERYGYIWGETGTGCTHLLQACCNEINKKNHKIAYISLANIKDLTPEVFDNLEQMSLICIDDVEQILGQKNWEESLFHLYNRVRELNTRLLIAGKDAPHRLPFCLPDLQSRLASSLVYEVKKLNDEQTILALQLRASHRGFHLSRDVGMYLIRRYPRNMRILFDVLQKLDHASLVAKRRLTIPFVKNVLG